jgi:hypothetical protein
MINYVNTSQCAGSWESKKERRQNRSDREASVTDPAMITPRSSLKQVVYRLATLDLSFLDKGRRKLVKYREKANKIPVLNNKILSLPRFEKEHG